MIGPRPLVKNCERVRQHRAGVRAQRLDLLRRRDVRVEELDRGPACAERDRQGDVRHLALAVRDLERPPADVEQHDPPRTPAVPAARGEERERGLLLTREDPHLLAEDLLDLTDHVSAVGCLAHR